ncbi:LysR substrate-binding domain-containing protein [Marinobacterium sedimentorum]|uniref:LysR substrate-binding domain-containing protein n=1 Tax=Marinobacterium sedimentorum TaxID=2927804 RepID=UPI0020C64B88|nr:LysR substrate-binding domain-containing protein [Marinobacterium sedimentorum]MCP8687713.1 LysR substrate-binding domain-containing protein [Marinobacterium sedimentorum]
MHKRYPSMQSMTAFLQAVRTGSFTRAARQLNLTHSAISQQIRTLEEFIGQPLFLREGGGIELTDAGRLFAQILPDGLAQVDRALSSVKHRKVVLKLTLDVDGELAPRWFNARLPQLLRVLPHHEVTLLASLHSDRISLERVDLSLRYGYGDWNDCEMALLCSDRVSPVAAPSLLAALGLEPPLTPAQLLQMPLLGYSRRAWIPWLEAAGLEAREPDTPLVFDSAANLLDAAEAGLGAALVRGLLCRDALEAGRLVPLTGIAITAHYNLYAVWPQGHGEKVAPLVNAIRQLADESPLTPL